MLIFHVDANSAYLSWTAANLLENGYETDLRTVPSAIAGNPEKRHGIVLTKSIPAKKYGIQTGESLYQAFQKCPDLLVFPPDYDLYLLCSEAMYQNLYGYSHQIKLHSSIKTTTELFGVAECLVDEMWNREPIRAMSVHVSNLTRDNQVQITLFDSKDKLEWECIDKTVDLIRKKFGEKSIFRGTFTNSDIEPVQGGVNNGNYIMMGGYKQ